MFKIQFAEQRGESLELHGLITVPHMPAVGDQAVNDTLDPRTGKPVKVYAKVARVLVHPPQNPAVDAIVVMQVLRVEPVQAGNA